MNNGLTWNNERIRKAQNIVMERFAQNSVAGQLASYSQEDELETTVRRNRFDFNNAIVIDREVFGLYEPFSFCRLSRAQVDEFSTAQDNVLMQTKAITTLTRAASRLARWHDYLFFIGLEASRGLRPPLVEMPDPVNPPQSLREAALAAEGDGGVGPISVNAPLNEGLVAAVYEAVLRLETQGYFCKYHLVLGEVLWRELHRPTGGSMVLPRERIEPTLMNGRFYRTTTLPNNEALLVSLDGPTFDCVIAGDLVQYPRFEPLRVEPGPIQQNEEFYVFRVRERFAPRVRENRAIVRLVSQQQQLQPQLHQQEPQEQELPQQELRQQ